MSKGIKEFLSFIDNSPTAFHAVSNISKILDDQGFSKLSESSPWDIKKGGKYYVCRNYTSIVAVKIGNNLDNYSFNIAASHSDSPNFKIKENAEISVRDKYIQLNTEGYGGMIASTWLDRPLSVAGRVIIKNEKRYESRLVNIDRDLVLIPNLAIHMNRKVNEGISLNKQIDLLPLFAAGSKKKDALKNLIADELGIDKNDIYGSDLYLYNRMKSSIWGENNEFFSAGRIDNLECAFTSLKGFIKGANDSNIQIYACFDNEEVGSQTKQGAASTLLYDVLRRLNDKLGMSEEEFSCAIANSFMLSCDNAHAVHPNHPNKTDIGNCAYMNEGIVIKSHAGQKYTSDGVSMAIFKAICEKAKVPYQFFANRSDEPGGSTLGNIAMSQVSINAIDIGLAQLAMHSSYESAGVKDAGYMENVCKNFFDTCIRETEAGVFELR